MLVFTTFLVAGAFAAEYKYAGGAGTSKWANDWNSAKDADTGNSLWSSGAVPTSDNDYVIDKNIGWIYFKINSSTFLGGSLTIASPDITFDSFHRNDRLYIPNLTVNAGSRLITQTAGGYSTWPHGLWLTGTPRVDGTLTLRHKVVDGCNYLGGYLTGALTGNGLVTLAGDTQTSPKILGHNWRIVSDNSGFKGRFAFEITEAMTGGESFATGVEILNANALGGARDSFTPDALTVESWNGLVTVGSDITLNAANSGILMKGNSFFEVPSGYVLTVAEPIRLTGGFFKKGAGTLVLDSAITFGADGTAEPDGANNALSIKAGALKIDSPTALALSFAAGTALEVGPSAAQAEGGFCRSLAFDGQLPVTVDFSSLTSPDASVPVNLFKIPAELASKVANIQLSVKGNWAAGALSVSEPSEGLVTVKTTLTEKKFKIANTTGTAYGTELNDTLWEDGQAAQPTQAYSIPYAKWYQLRVGTSGKFNGKSLDLTNGTAVDMEVNGGGADIKSLFVDSASQVTFNHTWGGTRYLSGDVWTVDGTVRVVPKGDDKTSRFDLNAPLAGSGLVRIGLGGSYAWTVDAGGAVNQGLFADNSAYRGKFEISLANTVGKGEAYARGIEIADASALGGALAAPTPDALTLDSWNGLVATETLTLDTANRGIDLKANAFFDVAAGKTLMVKEPIRSEGGFYKRGAGTLALDSAITFGADGTAEPDGANNLLSIKAGALKIDSPTALALSFAAGTALEVGSSAAQAEGGFCRSLAFDGQLPVTVDFSSLTSPDASVPVNLFKIPAELASNVANIQLSVKGNWAAGALSVSEPSEGLVTVKTTLTEKKFKIANTTGTAYGTELNDTLWEDGQAAQPTQAYSIPYAEWYQLRVGTSGKFNGKSLDLTNGTAVDMEVNGGGAEIRSLFVDSASQVTFNHTWGGTRYLSGDVWTVDGTVRVVPKGDDKTSRFDLNAPLAGSGLVRIGLGGSYAWSADEGGAVNQGLFADNSAYCGKFEISLANTVGKGEAYARGIEIADASALGGALAVPTPDALTLHDFNGLVATETLTLDTANRGIDLKANAFFDVADGKTLTVKEPIRSEGGFYKRGAGTLVLDSAITFGADGTAEPDGANSRFAAKAGVLKIGSMTATKDLDIAFAAGAVLELPVATCPDGFLCRSLSTAGILDVAVDFANAAVEPGSMQKVVLFTLPEENAPAIAGRLNVVAKGGSPIPGAISTEPAGGGNVAVSATLKVPQEMVSATFTGATGDAGWVGHVINSETDRGGAYMWSDHLDAHPDGSYRYDRGSDAWTLFRTDSTGKFNGGALEVASGHFEVKLADFSEAGEINTFSLENLLVDAGAKFQLDSEDYTYWSDVRNLEGSGWRVDGNLVISPQKDWTRFSLNVPLSGSGLVTISGYKNGDWSAKAPANQVIASDNGQFRGKFTVGLARTAEGGIYARGIEIANAAALGGVLTVPTPDALTLASWNGLVATETLTLDTANRGITLKDNAFFEVASGKTLTVAEPIVAEGGFFKRGAGTLAFGAVAVTGADNTPFRVAAGAVRPTGTAGLAKLATTFADGAALEIGALDADPEIATNGFYQPLGITLEGAKLPVNVVFPSGFSFEDTVCVVLATVPTISAQALSGKIAVNAVGLAHRCAKSVRVESADDDLSRIVVDLSRDGLFVVVE